MIVAEHESWALAEPFTISRGTKTSAEVVVVTVVDEDCRGWAECVPYPHYGESIESVLTQIEDAVARLADLDRCRLQQLLPAGAARNALDCALWDLEAKREGQRVWERIGIEVPQQLLCAYTVSLSDADTMGSVARRNAHRPLLKVKLNDEEVAERVRAVHQGAPRARLIVDPNESWSLDMTQALMPELASNGVVLIEQPLPEGEDSGLAEIERLIPLAADESCHVSADIDRLVGIYDVVNIKLDKTGGLTEALRVVHRAQRHGLTIMIGCMVGTSLAMAPAMLIGSYAQFVDLDGPLLLAQDRPSGLRYSDGQVEMPEPALWG